MAALCATASPALGGSDTVVGAGQRGKAQKERDSCAAALCMLAKYLKPEKHHGKGQQTV